MNDPLVEWGLKLVLVAFHSEKLFIGFNPDLNSGSGAANSATSLSFKSIFSRPKAVRFFLYSTISVTRITFLKVQQREKKNNAYFSSNSTSFWANKVLSRCFQKIPPILPQTNGLGHMQQTSDSKKKSFPHRQSRGLRGIDPCLWIHLVNSCSTYFSSTILGFHLEFHWKMPDIRSALLCPINAKGLLLLCPSCRRLRMLWNSSWNNAAPSTHVHWSNQVHVCVLVEPYSLCFPLIHISPCVTSPSYPLAGWPSRTWLLNATKLPALWLPLW